jgi:hypothetical protein
VTVNPSLVNLTMSEAMSFKSFLTEVSKTLKVSGGSDRYPTYYADLVGNRAVVQYNAETKVCIVRTPLGVIPWKNFGKPKQVRLT